MLYLLAYRMSEAKDNRELTAYLQFWKAAEEYLQTSCRRTAPHVHAALQELATPLGPSVAEDLQLVGFRPLQHRRNGNDSMPSTRQVGHSAWQPPLPVLAGTDAATLLKSAAHERHSTSCNRLAACSGLCAS